MARHDSDPVDPGDIHIEDTEFVPPGTQRELFAKGVTLLIAQRAANSIDERDLHVPINTRWLYEQNALRHPLSSD